MTQSISDEDFLATIGNFRNQYGFAPTEAEIASHLGLAHTTVNRRLHRLENKLQQGRILFGKKLNGGLGRHRVWFFLTRHEAAFFGIECKDDTA